MRESLDILEEYEPDIVLFQAGVDALEQDGLGKLSVTREGMRTRNRMVFYFLIERK